MNKSKSQNNITKSPQRINYLNNEQHKKDSATIFHSPFKNGQKNNSFVNPTFTSCNIFYVDEGQNRQKKAYILNQNQKKKQKLYQQRLRQMERQQKIKEEKSQRKHKVNHNVFNPLQNEKKDKYKNKSIQGARQSDFTLKKQLDQLKDYRQKQVIKNSRESHNHNYQLQKRVTEVPVYLQKHHKNLDKERNDENSRRRQLFEFMQTQNQVKENKNYVKRKLQYQENEKMSRMIVHNQSLKQKDAQKISNKSKLLSEILKQQIRIKDSR